MLRAKGGLSQTSGPEHSRETGAMLSLAHITTHNISEGKRGVVSEHSGMGEMLW